MGGWLRVAWCEGRGGAVNVGHAACGWTTWNSFTGGAPRIHPAYFSYEKFGHLITLQTVQSVR